MNDTKIILFENQSIHSFWDEEQEERCFFVVDVVETLTDSTNPAHYLKKLRKRDVQPGEYIGTVCPRVAMKTATGVRKSFTVVDTRDTIYKTWSDITVKEYKQFKDPRKENLRDNITSKEVVIAHFTTTSRHAAVVDKMPTVAIFATVQNKGARTQIKSIFSNDWLERMNNTQKLRVAGR